MAVVRSNPPRGAFIPYLVCTLPIPCTYVKQRRRDDILPRAGQRNFFVKHRRNPRCGRRRHSRPFDHVRGPGSYNFNFVIPRSIYPARQSQSSSSPPVRSSDLLNPVGRRGRKGSSSLIWAPGEAPAWITSRSGSTFRTTTEAAEHGARAAWSSTCPDRPPYHSCRSYRRPPSPTRRRRASRPSLPSSRTAPRSGSAPSSSPSPPWPSRYAPPPRPGRVRPRPPAARSGRVSCRDCWKLRVFGIRKVSELLM